MAHEGFDVVEDTSEDVASEDGLEDALSEDTALVDTITPGPDGTDTEAPEGDCITGTTQTCFSDVGECFAGKALCVDGVWGECRGGRGPTEELCDGRDNDCNGFTDDRDPPCQCGDGEVEVCGTTDVGACQLGSRLCVDGVWGPCQGNIEPRSRLCTDEDRDCDGQPDHTQAPCECRHGDTRTCGSGVGVCREGSELCHHGAWGACLGGQGPRTLSADEGAVGLCNGEDDNCDGQIDEGCGCQPPETQPCGTAVGNCVIGTQTCLTDGTWGGCVGGVAPAARQCDEEDRDCDGTPDYLQAPCQCRDGDTRICGTSVGWCETGTQVCAGGAWAACEGGVMPRAELCNGLDDDCDGITDNDLAAPVAVACWTHPDGSLVCADPNERTVPPLATVQLDARQSSDPNGQNLSFAWRIAAAPPGSTASITNPGSARPSLFAQVAGIYRVCVTAINTSLCQSDEACVSIAVVPTSRVHVQLTWDKDDSDMDLHFMLSSINNFFHTGPGANVNCSRANDCFWVCPIPEWGAAGPADNPRLDIDNWTGFGPENMNLDQPFDQTFPIAVHYWCDRRGPAYDAGPWVGPSVATVRLYIDGLLVQTWSRELSRRQRWHVADLVWRGAESPPWSLTARDAVVTMPSLGCGDP